MRRLNVVFSPDARRDILSVFKWVEDVSKDSTVALRFTQRITAACRKIGDRPLAGRLRDDLAPGLRTFSFERKAVIAYRVHEDHVEIINVFYGGRDFEAFYQGEG